MLAHTLSEQAGSGEDVQALCGDVWGIGLQYDRSNEDEEEQEATVRITRHTWAE